MHKAGKLTRFALYLLLASLLLAACAPAAAEQPTSTVVLETLEIPPTPLPEQMSCTSVNAIERSAALEDLPFEPISEDDWVRGPQDGAVSIIEYGDFQCPFCAQLHPILSQLEAEHPDELTVAFRHFPLIGSEEEPIHPKAALSAQAAEAAGLQGAFWEMHDLLYDELAEWTEMSDEDFEAYLLSAADRLELDISQFAVDLHSEELETLAQEAWEYGVDMQLGGTPFLIINGFPYNGPTDYNSLNTIIRLELLREQQFGECPAFIIDPSLDYTATIETEKGDIVIQLFPEVAPNAVNSFVFLAQNDWFDGVTFHRVIPGFVAQSGDPTATGYGGPGYAFAIEVDENLLFDRAGLLAMANSGPTANGSQFFITFAPAGHLDLGYTIFGELLSGMDVLESLTARDPSEAAVLPPGDLIIDVRIETN